MHMPCNICTRTFIPKWNQHDWITEPKLKHLVNGNWPNKEIQKLQQFFFFGNRQLHQAPALTDLPLFAKELQTNKLVLACTAQSRFGSLKQPVKPVLSSFLALAHWNKAPEGPQGHNNMEIATSSKHDTP